MPKDNPAAYGDQGNNPHGGDNWSDTSPPPNQINSDTPGHDQMHDDGDDYSGDDASGISG